MGLETLSFWRSREKKHHLIPLCCAMCYALNYPRKLSLNLMLISWNQEVIPMFSLTNRKLKSVFFFLLQMFEKCFDEKTKPNLRSFENKLSVVVFRTCVELVGTNILLCFLRLGSNCIMDCERSHIALPRTHWITFTSYICNKCIMYTLLSLEIRSRKAKKDGRKEAY